MGKKHASQYANFGWLHFLFSDIGLSYKMEMTNYYNSILWIYQNNQTIYESLEAQIHSICYYNHVKKT